MSKFCAVVMMSAVMAGPSLAAPTKTGSHFNGTWSVELVTESGLCDSRARYAVSVNEGSVRLVSASDKARLSGRVDTDGTVGLSVSNGSASGAVTGRLQARSGGGTWKVSALCSGRWTATRSDTRTAQAE
ncbi:hypothetical protein ASG40_14765 [Methylobacterium sp. Leaf399]|uniref:hypothetical protein n=1 Tax=Methylobacterium sp. Leaf399 TaxID=1736364 RepID=UPI0006F25CE7|nr:hypothetical protein [Methylobacterium sp. Leaf399]KQT07254.1 hypothetical protein ASG40_14765 [Methylobacterium sp. Leaf399]